MPSLLISGDRCMYLCEYIYSDLTPLIGDRFRLETVNDITQKLQFSNDFQGFKFPLGIELFVIHYKKLVNP